MRGDYNASGRRVYEPATAQKDMSQEMGRGNNNMHVRGSIGPENKQQNMYHSIANQKQVK